MWKPPNPAYPKELTTLGDHIRKRRLDLRLLQHQVAGRLGVTKSTLEGWERNRHEVGLRQIPRVVEFLGYVPFTKPTDLGERIRLYRKLHGTSRQRFARQLGVDETTVWRWEVGLRRPTGGYRATLDQLMNS